MRVQFEAASGGLSVGPNQVPFELDCGDGSALLELAGRQIRLRPLRWGEKLRLARHAELGADFVDRQLLRLGLGEQAEALDEPERALLLAVARWLNGLELGRVGLPLDPTQLAAVTLELCRALGLGPLDLDGREALEVEALWEAARQAPAEQSRPATAGGASGSFGRPATLEDGFTRVVVVPGAPGGAGSVADGPAATDDDRVAPGAASAEGPRPSGEPAGPSAPEARVGGRFRVVDPASLLGRRPATGAEPSERLATEAVRLEPRTGSGVEPAEGYAPTRRQGVSAAPAPGVAALAGPVQAGPVLSATLVAAPAEPLRPPRRSDAPLVVPRFERPQVEAARPEQVGRSGPGGGQPVVAEASDEAAPPSSAGLFEREALFEALSERLEQAVGELGIEAWS